MNNLFGTTGVDSSFTLVPMGGSDFTRTGQPYTYDDVSAGQRSAADAVLDRARRVICPPRPARDAHGQPRDDADGDPWTAPPWMKANDSFDDQNGAGTLNPSAFQPFADYFVKFLQAYAAQGVPITAIAPENEPNSTAQFPAMNSRLTVRRSGSRRISSPRSRPPTSTRDCTGATSSGPTRPIQARCWTARPPVRSPASPGTAMAACRT